MITDAQIRKVHVLKNMLGMEVDDYLAMLSGFEQKDGSAAASCKQLSAEDASTLIDTLERLVDRRKDVIEKFYANGAQFKRILDLWGEISYAKDEEGRKKTLHSFLHKRFHVDRLSRIPKDRVPEIMYELNTMRKRERIQNF
ncbi:phage protein GemA/Gp16 family protein [Fibrobacterota bacterium]